MAKRINMKKLLNMYLATVVKEAIENGELNLFNTCSWARKENGGMADMQFENEVYALVEFFTR